MWSSLVYGTGKSVIVAILATIGTVVIGVVAGTVAGWFGGLTDTIISRITDVFFGLPFILGALVFLAIFPIRNVWTISAVLVVFGWTPLTRVDARQRDRHEASATTWTPPVRSVPATCSSSASTSWPTASRR